MLEIAKRAHLHKGHVNFNAQQTIGRRELEAPEQLAVNFADFWENLSAEDREFWSASFKLVAPQIPLRNHELEHDEIYTRSYTNIECETYSSDNSVALSEKIFRVLVSPSPWTAYMGRYGVAYLESLGFDCMQDIIDHNHYDRLKEVENKNNIFVWKSMRVVNDMRTADPAVIGQRCSQAAAHNQALLAEFKQRWGRDFDLWQQQYMNQLA
jgi:hypothetical protein